MDDVRFRFSEQFGITPSPDDDWFDPLLPTDTKLFIDPFRVYAASEGSWTGAHAELIDFFNLVLELLARSGLNPASAHWQAAERLLMFPEPAEFCLGYGDTPLGMGSGAELRNVMLRAAKTTIELGFTSVGHFEEMVLFQENVGPDRVSDIVCNVLKARFIAYTKEICDQHGVETEPIEVAHSSWSRDYCRWDSQTVELPRNPWTGRAVILTPKHFLRRLPVFTPQDFWDWSFSHEAEQIKGQFNYDVATNVKAEEIAKLARNNPDLARKFIRGYEDRVPPPYDTDQDPKGRVRWYEAGQELATYLRPVAEPETTSDFCAFVKTLIEEFIWAVEQRGGWKLLWNPDGTPRAESAVQQLFHVTMLGYCKAHNIDLSPESAAGRGPVDFKFSRGWQDRALVEVKLSNHTRFWHGLDTQTPTYMKAEGITCGYFLAVQFRDEDTGHERVERVQRKAADMSAETGYSITPMFVDARPKPSASVA